MANAGIVPLAVLSMSVVIAMCVVYITLKRREVSEVVDDTPQAVVVPSKNAEPAEIQEGIVQPQPQAESKRGDYVRVKKELIGSQPEMRFSMLKDWISINMLAIFRRARGDWNTADDLIAIVPSYLEPEAEILNDRVLLIRTRGHGEILALPIRNLDTFPDLREYFDFVTNNRAVGNTPAVLLRSGPHFEVVSRGTIAHAVLPLPHTGAVERRYMEVHAFIAGTSASLHEGFAATFGPMESVIIAGWMARQSKDGFSQTVQEFFHHQRIGAQTVKQSEVR